MSKPPGLAPGTPVHVGRERVEDVRISVIDFDKAGFREEDIKDVDECRAFIGAPTVTWVNVKGIHRTDVVKKIGGVFNLHPLAIEDIVNSEQRPKIDDYDAYLFIVIKMIYPGGDNGEFMSEQVSLIVRPDAVISFQESGRDIFDAVRTRIKNGGGRVRKAGADYLAYALLDVIVDNYYIVLEDIGVQIESIEDELITNPGTATLHALHALKQRMLGIKKSVWPLREVIGRLERDESHIIKETTRTYIRDLYDHAIQVIETIEIFREMTTAMLDLYLSSVSNRTNEIVKVLTIMATIFIPLTFIAGIYGMNFKYMPELEWRWGYFAILAVMAFVSLGMLFYFRRKKWL